MPGSNAHSPRVHDAAREGLQQRGPGAPDDVEAWHRIAMSRSGVAAAFGPLDHREPADAQPVQPAPLLAGSKVDVRLSPAPRPIVLAAVKGGAAQPVGQGKLFGVVDPEPPLLRRNSP